MQKPEPRKTILLVDDDVEYCAALQNALADDFNVRTAYSIAEARDLLDGGIALALVDVRLREGSNDREGLVLLESIRQAYSDIPVVMMTAYADLDMAVEALRLGASHFIQKARIDIREFRSVLQNALRRAELERSNELLKKQLRSFEPSSLVGDDPKIRSVQEIVDIAASDSYCTVMVRGETGTGKELVAKAVHQHGRRKDKPFVAVSIAGLPPELVSAELFGHARGAFTDAKESRIGYIEKAQGGVLFLDEIGELRQDAQCALLRFLETRTFARVGSTTEIEVDIQIVCATNVNLEQAVADRQFREDLYYRLQSFAIWLPPLRERKGDTPLLADHFLAQLRENKRTKLAGIDPAALEKLKRYSFPGNVRELRNIIERAAILAGSRSHQLIESDDIEIGASVPNAARVTPIAIGENGVDLDEALARTELGYVQEALRLSKGRKTDAWKLLRLNDRFALHRRVKRIAEMYPEILESFPLVESHYRN